MNDAALESITFDERGLVPAVIQEAETGTVLMLAYMNRESLARTLATGQTHFWSRSRNALWHKGETSGNVQEVKGIRYDCDADALLVTVSQEGNACHTGAHSCFFNALEDAPGSGASAGEKDTVARSASFGTVVGTLAAVIHQRKADLPEGSYTAKLFTGGTDRILKKIGEESGEVIIAAKNHSRSELTWEVADLFYHTLVLLEQEGVSLTDIAAELDRRSKKM